MSPAELIPADPSFLGAPQWTPGTPSDVVFLGVPYDGGVLGSRGPRLGPAVIRASSGTYRVAPADRSRGWYDYVSERVVLRGLRLHDAGDLRLDFRAGSGSLRDLPDLLRLIRQDARVTVVLGGDDSLLHWCCRSFDKVSVVVLDAHEDATAPVGPTPHHGNVIAYVEQLEATASIIQFGLRGLVPNARSAPSPKRHIARTLDELTQLWMRSSVGDSALSLDLDVIDPVWLPSVAARSPGGLSPAGCLEVVDRLAAGGFRPRLFLASEFAPLGSEALGEGLLVVQLLMRAIDRLVEHNV